MKRRILSIDGGGIFGILPAHFLAALGPVDWDLVSGTSIGGIIACGLAHGVAAAAIENMLVQDGGTIFAKSLQRDVLRPFDARYSAEPLEAFLAQTFGDAMLSSASTNLLVPTCVLGTVSVMFFKSWVAKAKPSHDFALKDVARATSAAPTYFPHASIKSAAGEQFDCWDGGMGLNNPTLAAILDARHLWPGDELAVLSLGTGQRTKPISLRDDGFIGVLPNIVSAMMAFQVSPVERLASESPNAAVERVTITLPPGVDSDFDDASAENIAAIQTAAVTMAASENLDRARAVLA
jgi:hypothetical protein